MNFTVNQSLYTAAVLGCMGLSGGLYYFTESPSYILGGLIFAIVGFFSSSPDRLFPIFKSTLVLLIAASFLRYNGGLVLGTLPADAIGKFGVSLISALLLIIFINQKLVSKDRARK